MYTWSMMQIHLMTSRHRAKEEKKTVKKKTYTISGYKMSYVWTPVALPKWGKGYKGRKTGEGSEREATRKRSDQEGNAWGSRGKCVSG